MVMVRKDNRGRNLKEGESYRKDGRYVFRYADVKTGMRKSVYADTLPELREKEKELEQDINDQILTDRRYKNMTLNVLFQQYMKTRVLKDSTRANYLALWKNHVQDTLGKMKVVQIKPSDVKLFYTQLANENYTQSTISLIHTMLYPCLELAVEDDIIRKNPVRISGHDYGIPPKEKEALTQTQQNKLLEFISQDNCYNVYLPMLIIMIGTGCRAGELIGLTWQDVDMGKNEINISEQLIYKNFGDGYKFHRSAPKTAAGVRTIPMRKEVRAAFVKQKELNLLRGINSSYEIEGRKGFIFTSKNGRPLMPSALNNVLYNIVDAYNKKEEAKAQREKRKPEFMPHISAHTLRHTSCTRMAEEELDMKVVQYIMGHANINVTMDVYNHITDKTRVEKEIEKMNDLKIS